MKTTNIHSKENLRTRTTPPALPWRRFTTATIAALALACLAPAGAPPGQDASIGTARFVYYSDLNTALADYNLALANAHNRPTGEERAAARKQATADHKEAVKESRARFSKRRELGHSLNEDRHNPVIDPADFLSVEQIAANPNPLYPLIPGTTMTYRAQTDEGIEEITVVITNETRVILGVTCINVLDTVKLNGMVIEDTIDWFAQDQTGNVWYFGESTAEYEDGLITNIDGAWRADLGDAKAGIVMLAQPVVGKVYRQELLYGEAEDAAEIISLVESVTVPHGTFAQCLKTKDFTPLDPGISEFKFYAPGVGNVLTIDVESGKRTELISVEKK